MSTSTKTQHGEQAASAFGSRVLAVAVVTVLGVCARVAFLIWHAPYDKDEIVSYADMLDVREGWFFSHYYGGTAMALGFAGFGIALCLLVRGGSGSTLVTVGAGLNIIGGFCVAAGLAAEGATYFYATDQRAIPAEPGADLLRHMFTHDGHITTLLAAGLVLCALGALCAAAGLWRARAVPAWVPVALTIGTLLLVGTPHAITWWASLPATVATAAVAYYAWRSTAADAV
jgi:hypothetical protein